MNILQIIIIIIIILVVYILLFVKKPNTNAGGEIYKYGDIRENLKTGDVILFSCRRIDGSFDKRVEYYFRTNFIGSEYSHAGIIFKSNDGVLKVIECTSNNHTGNDKSQRLNNYNKGGIRIIDLETLLKEYAKDNDGYFAIKFIEEEIPNRVILRKLKNYKNRTFPNKSWLYTLAVADVGISHSVGEKLAAHSDKNTMMCSEFVHHILNSCGVLKDYPSQIFWPHLITDGTFEKLENIKYSPPFKFTYDDNEENDNDNSNNN